MATAAPSRVSVRTPTSQEVIVQRANVAAFMLWAPMTACTGLEQLMQRMKRTQK